MSDRAANGRFVKGNHASPGRPKRATEQEYLDAMHDVIPLERWRRIVEKQARRAEERGDLIAFKALLPYFVGEPVQKQNLSGDVTLHVIREDKHA